MMRIRSRIALAAALSTLAASGARLNAQSAAYKLTAGDTLRYRNTTKMEGMVHGAAGDAPFTLTRDATYAFAFSGGESVVAWYDALSVDASGAMAGDKPNPDALLRLPFRLHMEPNGHVVTVKAPELPRTARLIAEIPPNLDDFFPTLPKSGKMVIGTEWTDTTTRTASDTAGNRFSQRRISHYVAISDTMIDGRAATVITQRTEVRITSTVPMKAEPYIAALSLSGEESGVSLFCATEGRLLSRERNGELHGAVTYKGPAEPWVVNQSYHYRRVDVLEREKP
jgi:hypothetical protein